MGDKTFAVSLDQTNPNFSTTKLTRQLKEMQKRYRQSIDFSHLSKTRFLIPKMNEQEFEDIKSMKSSVRESRYLKLVRES